MIHQTLKSAEITAQIVIFVGTETETETALFSNNLHNMIIKKDIWDINFIEILTAY